MGAGEVGGVEAGVNRELRGALANVKRGSVSGWERGARAGGTGAGTTATTVVGGSCVALPGVTGVGREGLRDLGKRLAKLPEGFDPHPTLRRILEERAKHYDSGEGLDWGAAEALAFASLLQQGVHVRVSGQDVERGTFSHRHALLVDVNTAKVTIPLANFLPGVQAPFRIVNSSLSEYAVCGYELGYSTANPNAVVIWEAQFGDFANGAQVIFDQYLSSMEWKWGTAVTGLVVNLPHGYDGMGPEHSSGRIERFLQGSDDDEELPMALLRKNRVLLRQVAENRDLNLLYPVLEDMIRTYNWQVCFPSTPANYFHVLRRQVHRAFRKPLINFYSKAFLRAPNISSYAEMGTGTLFQPIIDDPSVTHYDKVKKVILCTGQIYFHLRKHRDSSKKACKLALVRLEQLSPFPWLHVDAVLSRYPNKVAISWAQEEPMNMGAWNYVEPRLHNLLSFHHRKTTVRYVGRPPAAASAVGAKSMHDAEIARYLEEAMSGI